MAFLFSNDGLEKVAEVKVCTNVKWLKKHGVRGIVLWPRIMFANRADEIPEWLFRHELEHAYQIMRMGRWHFYLKYFWYSVRHGYESNPLEVEAFARQHDYLTTDEELLLCNLRNDCARSPSGSRLKSNLSISLLKSETS